VADTHTEELRAAHIAVTNDADSRRLRARCDWDTARPTLEEVSVGNADAAQWLGHSDWADLIGSGRGLGRCR
jgi:hypothetical protein